MNALAALVAISKQSSGTENLEIKYRPAALGSNPKRGVAIVQDAETFKKVIADIPADFEIVIADVEQIYAPEDTPPLGHINYLFDHARSRKGVLLFGNGDAVWPDAMREMLSKAGAQEVKLPSKPDMALAYADDAAPPDFDYDALPPVWAGWTKEMADALGCPVDYVAAALLVSASAWLGNSRRVAPTYDWIEPPHLWLVQIGKPSEGKTPSQKPFIEASKILEREEEPSWREIQNKHESDMEAAYAKLSKWKEEVKQAVNNNEMPPERPLDAINGLGFINGLAKRLHPKGSHPGLSDDDDGSFRLHVVLLTTRLLLARFDTWERA